MTKTARRGRGMAERSNRAMHKKHVCVSSPRKWIGFGSITCPLGLLCRCLVLKANQDEICHLLLFLCLKIIIT